MLSTMSTSVFTHILSKFFWNRYTKSRGGGGPAKKWKAIKAGLPWGYDYSDIIIRYDI